MKKTRYKSIYCDTLESVIQQANEIITANPGMTYKDFCIELHGEVYSDSDYPSLEYETEETPAEKIKREKEEAVQAERQAEWDRKNYEALKKKFEGKSV